MIDLRFLESRQELGVINKIHIDNILKTYVGIFPMEYLNSFNYAENYVKWEQFHNRGDREIILAKLNDEVIGFAAVNFYETFGCGLLDRLHVRSDMQHGGVGRRLISAAAGLLYNMGIGSMQIDVIDGNFRAETLYRQLGAQEIYSYIEARSNVRIVHKRLIWNDLEKIADRSIDNHFDYKDDDFKKILEQQFSLFGVGEYCDIFMRTFPEYRPERLFDNNPKSWRKRKQGFLIEEPQKILHTENIIITTGYYEPVKKQIEEIGCKSIVPYYPWHTYSKIGE